MNYNQGKIYKIVCNNTNNIYIGSTIKKYLCDRLSLHTHKYRNLKEKSNRGVFSIIGGGNYKIELIENFSCNNKKELLEREKEIIEEYKLSYNVVNEINPITTKEEYIKRAIEWGRNNPEKKKEIQKRYVENNKDIINEKKRVRVNCPHCNIEISKNSLKRHIDNSCKSITKL